MCRRWCLLRWAEEACRVVVVAWEWVEEECHRHNNNNGTHNRTGRMTVSDPCAANERTGNESRGTGSAHSGRRVVGRTRSDPARTDDRSERAAGDGTGPGAARGLVDGRAAERRLPRRRQRRRHLHPHPHHRQGIASGVAARKRTRSGRERTKVIERTRLIIMDEAMNV